MATWMLIAFLYQAPEDFHGYRQTVVVPGFISLEGCQKAYKAMQEVAQGVYTKGKCVEVYHRG